MAEFDRVSDRLDEAQQPACPGQKAAIPGLGNISQPGPAFGAVTFGNCRAILDERHMELSLAAVNMYLDHLVETGVLTAALRPHFGAEEYLAYFQGEDPFRGLCRFLSGEKILDYNQAPTHEEPHSQESILAAARFIPRRRPCNWRIAFQFDQDGVLTRTPHEECWKAVFDEVLKAHGQALFTSKDYHTIISGRNRFEAIYDYLVQRGILPDTAASRCAAVVSRIPLVFEIADKKNRLVRARLKNDPIVRVSGMIELLVEVHEQYGIPASVVSASKSTNLATARAGIAQYLDVSLEGRVTEMLGIPGKPAGDVYRLAAQQLGIEPQSTVVFEDSPKGVAAAVAAKAGLVVGYAAPEISAELRKFGVNLHEQLEEAGAHVIVSDVRKELSIKAIVKKLGGEMGPTRV